MGTMDLQNIIVSLIVLSAFTYAGAMLWKKMKSFSVKKACNAGCGCNAAKEKLT